MTKMQMFLLCAVSLGCVSGGTFAWIETPLRNAKRLFEDTGFTETDKYGSVYKKYLISSFEENNGFFDYVYKWWYNKNNHKGRFEQITKGSGSEQTSIQKTCGDAYKESKVDVSGSKIKKYGTNENIETSDFREEDIWALCSARGYRIKTIAEAEDEEKTYDEGTYGNKYKDKLVSTYARGTGGFWDLGYNWEKVWKNNTNNTTAFEKRFKEKKEDYERRLKSRRYSRYDVAYDLDRAIRGECRKAYHIKEEENNTLYPKEQVLKYCALIPEEETEKS